jgi:hypothetical protein
VPHLTETAALLRFGLLFGYVSVPEVVAWADAEIAARTHPHPVLLEVSTGGRRTPADLASDLGPLAEGCDEAEIIDRVLALMHRALSRDPGLARRLASTLYSFAIADTLPSGGDPEGLMLYFDDALDLARDGVSGTEDAVVQEMLRFLAPYANLAPEQGAAGDVRPGTVPE